jgi:hypothetical protein
MKTLRIMLITTLPVLALFLAGTVQAQSVEELRRENQQLRDRIKELERQIHDLGRGTPATAPTPPASQPAGSQPDDATPLNLSNPNAVIEAIRARWNEDAKDVVVGEPNSRERTAYLRFVDKWMAATNRHYRKRIEWPVRLQSAERIDGDYMLRVVVVDPETGADIGDPFPVQISRLQASKLETWQRRSGGYLDLKGVLIPQVRLNLDRNEVGVFDNPSFVAPYVEFTFNTQVESIAPKSAAKPKQGKDAPPSSRPGTR